MSNIHHSLKSIYIYIQALCYGDYGYQILFNRRYTFSHRDKFTMIPNWFSYRGKGRSLSFHVPPVFEGLVVGVVWQGQTSEKCMVIIKNKSNGIQLFEATVDDYRCRSWLRCISISEMAMKEYSGDEELELCVVLLGMDSGDEELEPGVKLLLDREYYSSCVEVFECGIHVIVEKTEAFEGSEWDHESEVGRDRVVIPAPPYLSQDALSNFIEIDGKQGLSNVSKYTTGWLLQVLFLSLLHTNKHTTGTHKH